MRKECALFRLGVAAASVASFWQPSWAAADELLGIGPTSYTGGAPSVTAGQWGGFHWTAGSDNSSLRDDRNFTFGQHWSPDDGRNRFFSFQFQEAGRTSSGEMTLGLKSDHDQSVAAAHFFRSEGTGGEDRQSAMIASYAAEITPDVVLGPVVGTGQLANFSGMNWQFQHDGAYSDAVTQSRSAALALKQGLPFRVESAQISMLGLTGRSARLNVDAAWIGTSKVSMADRENPYLRVDDKSAYSLDISGNGFFIEDSVFVPSFSGFTIPDGSEVYKLQVEHSSGNLAAEVKRELQLGVRSGAGYTLVDRDFKESRRISTEQRILPLFGKDMALRLGAYSDNQGGFPVELGLSVAMESGAIVSAGTREGKAGLSYRWLDPESGQGINFSAEHQIQGSRPEDSMMLHYTIPMHRPAASHSALVAHERQIGLGIGTQAKTIEKSLHDAQGAQRQSKAELSRLKEKLSRQTQDLMTQYERAMASRDVAATQSYKWQVLASLDRDIAMANMAGRDSREILGLRNSVEQAMVGAQTAQAPILTSAANAALAAKVAGGILLAGGVAAVAAGAVGGGNESTPQSASSSLSTSLTDGTQTIDEYGAGSTVTYSSTYFDNLITGGSSSYDSIKIVTTDSSLKLSGVAVSVGDVITRANLGNLTYSGDSTPGTETWSWKIVKNGVVGSNIATETITENDVDASVTNMAGSGSVAAGATAYITATISNMKYEYATSALALQNLEGDKVTDNGAVTLGPIEVVDFDLGQIRLSYTGIASVGARTDQVVIRFTEDGTTHQTASIAITKTP